MAIEQMDVVNLTRIFNDLCKEGSDDSDTMYRFIQNHLIPHYEATKKQLCADALHQGAKELIDWIWEDPMNPTPYSQLETLKNIAKELQITLNDGRTS